MFRRGWGAGLEEGGFNDQHEGCRDGHNDDDAVEQFPIYKSVEVVRCDKLSLIHISEPTRREWLSRMPSSA